MNKLIAFGDIHGCYPAAAKAVEISEELGAKSIFLGDYVDRGPSAVKTLQILNEAKRKHPDWIFLRGNHDQMLLDLIHEKAKPTDIGTALDSGFDYWQAAKSLGEWKELDGTGRQEIYDFLNETTLFHETPEFIFCHAILRDTGEPIEKKSLDELIWNYEYSPFWEGKRFVHGHYPEEKVRKKGMGICINTRCGYGGVLTGLILDERNPRDFTTIQIREDGSLVTP